MCAACGHIGFDEVPPLDPPAHVPDTTLLVGTGTLVLGDAVIDTTELSIDGAPPAHGQLVAVAQPGANTELALLQADHIIVEGTVRVRGARGLVLLARTVEVTGTLDGGARGAMPGPGAAAERGGPGVHPAGVCDSGGGGGGHMTAGAAGGDGGGCTGGAGGALLGDPALTLLVGGGAGGEGVTAACGLPPGGGGGGALQLSAQDRVTIAGTVTAGGGGGAGGLECGDGDAGSGGGGGAGGAIYIEAARVEITGVVAAHGGGGGGGGNGAAENGPIGRGSDGTDGGPNAPAAGGAPAAPNGGTGGAGGVDGSSPQLGASAQHNAGGGGGAAGRIVIVTP